MTPKGTLIDKLEDWVNRNIMKSSTKKHKVMYTGYNDLKVQAAVVPPK